MNAEGKRLAHIVKRTHKRLRRKYKEERDEQTIWTEHITREEELQCYSNSMVTLATQHWPSQQVMSQVDWCYQAVCQYYQGDRLSQANEKEARKMSHLNLSPLYTSPQRPSTILQVLDVGSCYNPFSNYPDWCVTAIDLYPANKSVKKGDFLNITITEPHNKHLYYIDPENISTVTPEDGEKKMGSEFENVKKMGIGFEDEKKMGSGFEDGKKMGGGFEDGKKMGGGFEDGEKMEYKIVENSVIPTEPNIRSVLPTKQNIASEIPTKTEQPSVLPTKTEQPSELPTTTEGPSVLPTKTEQPSELPTTIEGPSVLPTKTEQPSELPTCQEIRTLPGSFYDVVIFSLLLEYLPSPSQRLACCRNAYRVLKPGGILALITPDSKHQNANAHVYKLWRLSLSYLGFSRVKYQKCAHFHGLVFRKALCFEACLHDAARLMQDVKGVQVKGKFARIDYDKVKYEMYIPQDFNEDESDSEKE
ncbi:hypothetical protein Pcinc_023214 [Petrolisthes cinctipes]|uniref:S-adenosylmethionine sensor upstream of mTORC1 n=1 Tax=Petrolisthes cinctipes TaxID=88211 RepID=A0AAE1KCI2_PETCI|nr:hypothetical protein Pcinc_023214 [Petrolisthes cinctipes]